MDPAAKSTHVGVIEKIQRRQEDREERSRQRRQEREEEEGPSSSAAADNFFRSFQGLREALKSRLESAGEVDEEEVSGYLDGLVRDVQEMQDLLNESARFLASFQQKKSQREVDEAAAEVQNAVGKLQPKKRFGFGRKKATGKPKTVGKVDEADRRVTEESSLALDALDGLMDRQFFGFKDETGQSLTVVPEELAGRQLNLTNLSDCTVTALGTLATIQASNLNRCTVLVGPAARSAFIKDCRGCTFVLAGQQMRVHDTTDTDLYIHVTGAAVIEGSSRVRVAPYTLSYPALDQHYGASGLNRTVNRWDQLDDFDWLKEGEPSPNWSVIPPTDRRSDWLTGTEEV